MSNQLNSQLFSFIKEFGPVPIDVLMCLAAAKHYSTSLISSHFITAPEIGQLFGATICEWLFSHCKQGTGDITLIELGPGNGSLMADVIKYLDGHGERIYEVLLVENSPLLRSQQRLIIDRQNVRWFNSIESLNSFLKKEPRQLFIIANEFFDALPIKQFIKINNELREVMVGLQEETLVLTSKIIQSPLNLHAEDLSIYEYSPVRLAAFSFLLQILKCSAAGSSALIIDYGYTSSPLKSTLQAVYCNQKLQHFTQMLGEADISALVDFSSFIEILQASPKISYSILLQKDFLRLHGIMTRFEVLAKSSSNPNYLKCELNTLVSDEKMGELFKVLEIKNLCNH